MAIGVVDKNEFEEEMRALRIKQELEDKVTEECRSLVRGRGNKPAVPMALRAVIAGEATEGAPSKELQNAFGVSASSVSAYANGATSTSSYNTPRSEISGAISAANENIGRIATHKLLRALDAITDNKVADLSPLKAADLASKMSNVIKNTRPDEIRDGGVKIVVFQPRIKEEDEFEVIEVLDE